MSNHIAFDRVSKIYGNRLVLDQISFTVAGGSFMGLIGNNGSGKTTVINIMGNLIAKDSGEVRVFGEKITANDVHFKRHLGIVLSDPYYVEDLDISSYLKFVGRLQGVDNRQIDARTQDLVELLRISEYSVTPIRKLSSGTQMKVSLAAAMIHNPKILILDEPFVNLDVDTSQLLVKTLVNLKGRKTVFVTSHNLDLISDLCDEFLILDQGKIKMCLTKGQYNSNFELKEEIKKGLELVHTDINLSWLY